VAPFEIARRDIHHSQIPDGIKPDRNKKMPAYEGRAQPKIGPRDAESGAAHRCAARLSAITHIGCVYADESSIGSECDQGMTQLKQILGPHERMQLRSVY
jgi:hypothetical protein